jgi:hypothetical protein
MTAAKQTILSQEHAMRRFFLSLAAVAVVFCVSSVCSAQSWNYFDPTNQVWDPGSQSFIRQTNPLWPSSGTPGGTLVGAYLDMIDGVNRPVQQFPPPVTQQTTPSDFPYYWDGQQFLPSSQAMEQPEYQWLWDGSQWQLHRVR